MTAWLILTAMIGPAAPPDEELLRRLPADTGFVFLVRNMAAESERFRQSEFGRRWIASPMNRWWQEAIALPEFDRDLKALGTGWDEFHELFLRHSLAVAYRPGPPDRPGDEHGLFLVQSADADRARAWIDRSTAALQQAGELTAIEHRSHAGRSYSELRKRRGPPDYLAVVGTVVLLSPHEAFLREALAADNRAIGGSLARLGVDRSPIIWWFNPAAFLPAMKAKPRADNPTVRALAEDWSALDAMAGFVEFADELRIGITAIGRPDDLSAATRALFTGLMRPSAWQFPDGAMLTVRLHVPTRAISDWVGHFLGPDERATAAAELTKLLTPLLGREGLAALPDALGPDWGMAILPSAGPIPDAVAAVRLEDGPPGVPVGRRVRDGLHLWASMTIADYNVRRSQRLKLRGTDVDGADVRFVEGGPWPASVRPSFGRVENRLVIATRPEVIGTARLGRAEPGPLLTADPPKWADWLHRHGPSVFGLKPEVGAPWIESLRFVRSAELRLRAESDQATLTLHLTP